MALPVLLFGSSDSASVYQIKKLIAGGKVRKLLPTVYTSLVREKDEVIVRNNLWQLIAVLYPGSILSHRSAIEFKPSINRILYLTRDARRVVKWPGITLKFTDGPAPQLDDNPIYEKLFASSLERAVLENLLPSRISGGERRSMEQGVIEERLVQVLNSRGEKGLNTFRDRARAISELFGWGKAFSRLDGIISALLATNPSGALTSPLATAIAFGRPYDDSRVRLFNDLAAALRKRVAPDRPTKTITAEAYANFALFESYFSNYIEGTTFRVDEALRIINEQEIIPLRSEDSHDVSATYQICSDPTEMARTPASYEELIELLTSRHGRLMAARPYLLPGEFKINANRAGNTYFVRPKQVRGTLEQGFKLLTNLTSPYDRALFTMFLISEVHPFEDGNGRIARLMMNAELSAGEQTKVIIPIVYRDDYLLNLRRLTRKGDTDAYLRMMDRAHAFSHWLEPATYGEIKAQLERSNAFEEEDAVLRF